MAQDFAKQRSIPDPGKRRRAVSKTPPPGNANWSWFFSGLMSGIIVSIAAYLGMLKLEEGAVEEAQAAQLAVGPENQPTYSFYEVLTQAEVAVTAPEVATLPEQIPAANPEPAGAAPVNATEVTPAVTPAVPPAQTAKIEAKPDLYLLQAGSYQNRQDAENQRARIILLNLNANIAEGIVGGRTHYRVQVGPFAGRQSADAARSLLTGNDIESIFLRVAQ
ncbi:MAG TPA: SPOR domain-containing protein [Pseudomonadales bacterium]